jgi:hypothetical protein
VLYVGEGFKRNRNVVAIGNADPRVVSLSTRWLRRLSSNPVRFGLQYHADQDLAELRQFWAALLELDAADITVQRKSNSGQLNGRSWRSRYGVLTVRTSDTLLRARLQAWMDCLMAQWIDSPASGA